MTTIKALFEGEKMRLMHLIVAFVFIALCPGNESFAEDKVPKVPVIENNICPFECCQYGKWITRSPIKAYKQEGDDSNISFLIQAGEEFKAIGGNVHIIKLGIITINESFGGFSKGDKVYVLSYRGEGEYDLWYKGKQLDSTDDVWKHGTLKQSPEFIWWVSVINKDGKRGWLRFKNIGEGGFQTEEKIDGRDSCS